MRTCIIFNPAARSEKARRFIDRLHQLARDTVIKMTEGPGDAEAQAERAVEQGYNTIVAAGGDGTINEIVNGCNGAPIQLGILPIGTVNVFAMELGIPLDLEKAWAVIQRRKVRLLDLPTANDQKFVQLAGVGLDAQIVEKTDRNTKKVLGPLSYLLTATQIAAQKAPRLRVHADHKTIEGSFVVIGNGRFYGGPFMLFTEANMEDGLLDICVFKQVNYLALVRYFRGVLFGSHTSFSDVRYFKAKSVRIESEDEVPVEADGELIGHLPCEFKIGRQKLKVIVP